MDTLSEKYQNGEMTNDRGQFSKENGGVVQFTVKLEGCQLHIPDTDEMDYNVCRD